MRAGARSWLRARMSDCTFAPSISFLTIVHGLSKSPALARVRVRVTGTRSEIESFRTCFEILFPGVASVRSWFLLI